MTYYNNINGTNGTTGYATIAGVSTRLTTARVKDQYKVQAARSTYAAGNGVAISSSPSGYRKINASSNDRLYPEPSGYAANGTPTYGSGKTSTNVTYKSDHSLSAASGSFTYLTQGGRVKMQFSSLT